MRVAGVVFAAGASRRMAGRNKMLLELDGEPLVRRAVRHAQEAGLSPVVVVVGFEQARVRSALHGLDAVIAVNDAYAGPMSTSMHVALETLPADVDGAIVILGDMIHVTSGMIREVAATPERTRAPLVVSRYGDVTAPPILFNRSLFAELMEWSGEGCGKPVVRDHAHESAYCEWPAALVADVDTLEDWESVGFLLSAQRFTLPGS